jgi:hypothetical protein
MAEEEHIRDIREEMRVAVFWRKLIGDMEYVKYDPEDMYRWYEALELRGAYEIRLVRQERYATQQGGVMQGIVSKSPHPPMWLVNEWLEYAESKTPTLGLWGMAGCFVVLSGMFFGYLQGCANLQPLNPLILHPPRDTPPVAAYSVPSVSAPGGNPSEGQTAMQPKTVAAPPSPTATGPSSNGIAGGATGQVSPTGATGGQNSGASAGVQP